MSAPTSAHRATRAMTLAGLAVLAGCAAASAAPRALYAGIREARPLAAPQDYYKAVYQACLGPEHDLGDRDSARARLRDELDAATGAAPGEPLIEPLFVADAPEPMARVNLRPLRAQGVALDALLDAMFSARPAGAAGRACLLRNWHAIAPALGPAGTELTTALESRGYPPVHHSDAYRAAYAPSYRVAPLAALRRNGLAR